MSTKCVSKVSSYHGVLAVPGDQTHLQFYLWKMLDRIWSTKKLLDIFIESCCCDFHVQKTSRQAFVSSIFLPVTVKLASILSLTNTKTKSVCLSCQWTGSLFVFFCNPMESNSEHAYSWNNRTMYSVLVVSYRERVREKQREPMLTTCHVFLAHEHIVIDNGHTWLVTASQVKWLSLCWQSKQQLYYTFLLYFLWMCIALVWCACIYASQGGSWVCRPADHRHSWGTFMSTSLTHSH